MDVSSRIIPRLRPRSQLHTFPPEIITNIFIMGLSHTIRDWPSSQGDRKYVAKWRLICKSITALVDEVALSNLGDQGYKEARSFNLHLLALVIFHKERNGCDSPLATLGRRLRKAISDLPHPEVNTKRLVDMAYTSDALDRDTKLFLLGMVIYLGLTDAIYHFLSRQMPDSVAFLGIKFSDAELVALLRVMQQDNEALGSFITSAKATIGVRFYDVAFYIASFIGNVEACAMLFDAGNLSFDILLKQKRDPILCAVTFCHIEVIKFFIQRGIDFRKITTWNPLIIAAQKGNVAAVRLLLDHVVLQNKDRKTLLLTVPGLGTAEQTRNFGTILELLLEKLLNVSLSELSALISIAISFKNDALVKVLFQHAAALNFTFADLSYPFELLLMTDNLPLVESLLKEGQYLKDKPAMHKALEYSLETGNEAAFDLLIDKAPFPIEDDFLERCIFLAISSRREDAVRFLIKRGVNPYNNAHSLKESLISSNSTRMLEILMENGDVAAEAKLSVAISANDVELFQCFLQEQRLLRGGEPVFSPGWEMDSVRLLILAIDRCCEPIVKLLLESGADCEMEGFAQIMLRSVGAKAFGIAKLLLQYRKTSFCLIPFRILRVVKPTSAQPIFLAFKLGQVSGTIDKVRRIVKAYYGPEMVDFMEYLLLDTKVVTVSPIPLPGIEFRMSLVYTPLKIFIASCYGPEALPLFIEDAVYSKDEGLLEYLLGRLANREEEAARGMKENQSITYFLHRLLHVAVRRYDYLTTELLVNYGIFREPQLMTGETYDRINIKTVLQPALKCSELIFRLLFDIKEARELDDQDITDLLSDVNEENAPLVLLLETRMKKKGNMLVP
ncbi:hypothetical protein FQN57_006056 [Myotisia sp. PD_48]|nr:hypothetical protein FQN57_006056 [Myotisia sp. PD_48]